MVVVLLYILPAVGALAVLIAALRSGRCIRTLLGSALKGAVSLLAVNAAGALTGVTVAVNPVTLAAVGIFGIPGCTGLVLLDLICR